MFKEVFMFLFHIVFYGLLNSFHTVFIRSLCGFHDFPRFFPMVFNGTIIVNYTLNLLVAVKNCSGRRSRMNKNVLIALEAWDCVGCLFQTI